jgi:hypothetical protein
MEVSPFYAPSGAANSEYAVASGNVSSGDSQLFQFSYNLFDLLLGDFERPGAVDNFVSQGALFFHGHLRRDPLLGMFERKAALP